MNHRRACTLAALTTLLAAFLGTSAGEAAPRSPTLAQMVGQLLFVRMSGTDPSAAFLARIRRGEIGGVILFSDNLDASGPAKLIARLQSAARAGHQAPLLVAIDQEGGLVKRLPGAPSLSPSQMSNPTIAEAQGLATARNLKPLGFNVDLAPVLDVDHGGFIAPRSFGTIAADVARRGGAFAAGLRRGHLIAAAKHFPGLGYATLSTDSSIATIHATSRQLTADLFPFAQAIKGGIPIVMLSTALYQALDPTTLAAFSPRIIEGLLRRQLGFSGVVVTDALQTPAVNSRYSTAEAAVRAVAAGADMVIAAGVTSDYTDTDGASRPAYAALLEAAHSGALGRTTLEAAFARVEDLKRRIAVSG